MKKLLFILLTLFTLQSFAQDTSYVKVRNGIPGVYNLTKNGDSLVFYVSGERFALSVGSVVDLTPFLRKADTASMLLPYATKSKVQADSMTLAAAISGYTTLSKYKTDSTSFQNQINSKQPAGTYVVPADIDEVFVNSEFDTSSRSLTLTRKDGTSQSVVIPRGTASGVSGIADLSKSRTGDLVTIS
jgi:hypothetical protein